MESAELFDAGRKGRGLRAAKELKTGEVVFAEPSFSAVVFDRYVESSGCSLRLAGKQRDLIFSHCACLQRAHCKCAVDCRSGVLALFRDLIHVLTHDLSSEKDAKVLCELDCDVLGDSVFKSKQGPTKIIDTTKLNMSQLRKTSCFELLLTQCGVKGQGLEVMVMWLDITSLYWKETSPKASDLIKNSYMSPTYIHQIITLAECQISYLACFLTCSLEFEWKKKSFSSNKYSEFKIIFIMLKCKKNTYLCLLLLLLLDYVYYFYMY